MMSAVKNAYLTNNCTVSPFNSNCYRTNMFLFAFRITRFLPKTWLQSYGKGHIDATIYRV